ncbi:5131_t:CDS:2 [Funneliformis geosporum]|uniref:4428_t:CDS:1 n=1 Tax=Funneliformis geosporum TaxID=1117311 RepID=A0A9W4SGE9_9GLOM|nr:4428_t:CDS:2 [Funneliformis geosporum]CAI2168704.1 5131_t:CDS:2 [Funneliformis geosporum]
MDNNDVSLVEDTHHKSPSIQQTTRTSHTTSKLVHSHTVNLSMQPGGTHPLGSLIHPTPTPSPTPLSSQQSQAQQQIKFVFERFSSGVNTPSSMNTPIPSPRPVIRLDEDATPDVMDIRKTHKTQLTINTTQSTDFAKKNRNKRKHRSYRTSLDSPVSLNRDEDSKSDSDYGDPMITEYTTRSEAFSVGYFTFKEKLDYTDYDMDDSVTPVEALKRLLMQFTAMSHRRLELILPVLLDNDIDDPEILLLIENEQFLRDLRGKNGSSLSIGNILTLWHGIQEHRNGANADLISSQLAAPKAKRPRLDLLERDDHRNVSSSGHDSRSHHHHNNNVGNIKQRVKAPKLSMSTIEEVHTRVDCVLSVVAAENERRKHFALSRNINARPSVRFEDFVAELKSSHKIPVAFGTLRDMRFAYMLKKLDRQRYADTLTRNRSNVTEFYRSCQEVCEENFKDDELEAALPWLELKAKMYYK